MYLMGRDVWLAVLEGEAKMGFLLPLDWLSLEQQDLNSRF